MDSHIMHARNPSNGFPCFAGPPLFDWAPPVPTRLSPRDTRAARIALATGLPIGVVLVHFQAAGLGMEG